MAWLKNRSKFHNTASTVSSVAVYPDLRPSTAEHSQIIAASSKYIALAWAARGGASIGILRHSQTGKREQDVPLIHANSQPVWDLVFHPYKDDLLISTGEDQAIHLTRIPDNFDSNVNAESLAVLTGHGRTVSSLRPSLAVDSLLASTALDGDVNLWDLNRGSDGGPVSSTNVGSDAYDASWTDDGGNLFVTSKDRKVHVVDPRQKKVALEAVGHEGTKPSKCVWLGNTGRAATTGFTKMRERELLIWDARALGKPLTRHSYGSSPAVLTPHFDADSKLLFLAGRGEGTVHTLDMSSDKAPFFADLITGRHQDKESQISVALLPKRALDVMDCEVARMFRALKDSVQVVHFHVSRRNKDFFQDELYPPSPSAPSISIDQYLGGQTKGPVLTSLEPKS